MCENTNTAPFAIGEKVVCIKTTVSKKGVFKITAGEVFKVLDLWLCPGCNRWKIDIGFVDIKSNSGCAYCIVVHHINDNRIWARANLFAPIETQYADITKELAASIKHTDEVPDKILIPEIAN